MQERQPQNGPGERADQIAKAVIGCAIEVHKTLGPGYLEVIYEKAMAVEMSLRGLAFSQQVPIELRYKGQPVGEGRLDLLVDSQVIVELKAVESLATIHQAQLLSYLRATGLRLGLLLNFNVPVLRDGIMRVVL